jgi:hypothetical protein
MQAQSPELGATVKIKGNLRDFLESEREALSKTCSMLQCLAVALEEINPAKGPWYPGLCELAAELVHRREFNLELLDGRLPAVVTVC